MTEDVANSLTKAEEYLTEGKLLLNNESWNTCISSCYLAMYHSVKAILLSKKIKTNNHQEVKEQFAEHFIKTGVFFKHIYRSYNKIFKANTQIDNGFYCLFEDAEQALAEASLFNYDLRNYIENKIKP